MFQGVAEGVAATIPIDLGGAETNSRMAADPLNQIASRGVS